MHCVLRGTELAACVLLCSCSYVKNRVNDLLDPFRFDVGIGPGLYAEARVTDFAAVGLGLRYQETVGLHGRFAASHLVEGAALGPIVLNSVIYGSPQSLLGGDDEHDRDHDLVACQLLIVPIMNFERCGDGRWSLVRRGVHVLDVGMDVTLGYVGVGAGFSPGEFVDLLFGFVGIDIAGDDVAGVPQGVEVPPQNPEPKTS